MKRTLTLACAGALAAASLAAGCGGGGGSGTTTGVEPADEWAQGFCGATTTWTNALKQSAADVADGPFTREAVDSALSDARKATQTYRSTLKDLGRPDTNGGQKAQAELQSLSSLLSTGMNRIQDAVASAKGGTSVMEAVSVVSSTLVTMGKQVDAAVANLKQLDPKGELSQAFQNSQACADLKA